MLVDKFGPTFRHFFDKVGIPIHIENDARMLVVKKSCRGRLIVIGFCIKSIGYIIRGMKMWSLKGLVFKRDCTVLKTNSLCPFTKQDSILSIPEF